MKNLCVTIFMLICLTACSTTHGPDAGPGHVLVTLSKANICFENNCYPALVGKDTPIGIFTMTKLSYSGPGYNGEIIKFAEVGSKSYAIHRLWLLRPSENRDIRIAIDDPGQRLITKGCINVTSEVYEKLINNHIFDTLVIER